MGKLKDVTLAIVCGYVLADMFGLPKSDCINVAFISASGPIILFVFGLFEKKMP